MSKRTRGWSVMRAAVLVVAGTALLEAGTTHRASVSGVKCGYTVAVEATVQCPQGDQGCNPPQGASGILEVTWPNSGSLKETVSLSVTSPRDSARRWTVRGSIKVGSELPEGQTASGDFALVLNEDYAIEDVKVTVKK